MKNINMKKNYEIVLSNNNFITNHRKSTKFYEKEIKSIHDESPNNCNSTESYSSIS